VPLLRESAPSLQIALSLYLDIMMCCRLSSRLRHLTQSYRLCFGSCGVMIAVKKRKELRARIETPARDFPGNTQFPEVQLARLLR